MHKHAKARHCERSEAIQKLSFTGLLRHFVPRNDGLLHVYACFCLTRQTPCRQAAPKDMKMSIYRTAPLALPPLHTKYLQSALDNKCKACYANHAKRAIQRGDLMKTLIPGLRKQRKLSQEELASAVGVTRQTITSIEVGKYTASLVLAYKIAKYFNKTIEEVFDFSEVEDF